MSNEEFMPEFDEQKASVWSMRATNPNCASREELKERIYDFVKYNALQEAAMSRMSDLNRRFGQAAGKFGADSRTIISELVAAGRLKTYLTSGMRGTQMLLFPAGYLKLMQESMPPVEFEVALKRFKNAAHGM